MEVEFLDLDISDMYVCRVFHVQDLRFPENSFLESEFIWLVIFCHFYSV